MFQRPEKKECEFIELLTPNLNTSIPSRSNEERAIANHDKLQLYRQDQYNTNKKIIAEKSIQYGILNKVAKHARDKIYRDNHVEQMQEYKINWYNKNKQQLLEKHKCLCGGVYGKCYKSRHDKSNIHQQYLSSISINS